MCLLITKNRPGRRKATGTGRRWRFKLEKLVELVPVGSPLGEITPQASQATGIPAGLPLIAAAADKACEVLGSGSLEPQCCLPELRHHRHHQHHP